MVHHTTHALQNAIAQIEKAFGKGSVLCLEQEAAEQVEVVSTGSLGLDLALGIGGLPVGRIIEIYGPESSGKTTLSMHVIAEAQKQGGICAFIDVEHAFDKQYARKLGIQPENLYISQPDTGEQALEIADYFVRSGAIKVLVIDSVAALVPKAELEGDMGDSHMGLQARLMSQALRKLTSSISRSNIIVIFINQVRQKIGVVYGNPETTTGGNALKFYASVRLDIRRIGSIKGKANEEIRGNQVKVKVVKNKLAPPFREVTFDILYGQGISKVSELIDFGVRLDLISKSGSWYAYQSEKLGQGKESAEAYLLKNPEKMKELEDTIRASVRPKTDFFDWNASIDEEKSPKSEEKEEVSFLQEE
ncbi:protein RecA [Holospora obtusa F1]|uniref:Protein RecA n=1 Tax=Holospora obtusa F1 TaxID=1399147 RepID=W6TI79_HOLOB|nr:recombinase RecA [Holospora obtusa]ETZ07720.1 protein RecA [Holospora obtusa F1]